MNGWSILVDIVIVAFVAFGGWRGYKEGLFAASANVLGLVVSLLLAYLLYPPMSQLILKIWTFPQSIANVFAFLFLAFVIDGIVTSLILLIGTKFRPTAPGGSWLRYAGIGPGVLNSLITVGYLASLFIALPVQHPSKTAVQQSLLAAPLASAVNAFGAPADTLVAPAITDLSQLFTIEPDSKDMVDLKFTVQNPAVDPTDEEGMLSLLNQERTTRGLPAVTMDESLRQLARSHSLDMFQRGYFSHYTPEGKDPFDRMKAADIHYQSAGENLALAPTLPMAHTGLMNSPGHKRNILDPSYRKVGIGAYRDPRYGIMFSQEFTN